PAAALVATPTALSKAPADFGAKQQVTYTISTDTATPKASATVDFYVFAGAVVGENSEYIIYGASPQYLAASSVDAANADLAAAGHVYAFNKATGTPVDAAGIAAQPSSLSKDPSVFGVRQQVRYTVTADTSSPKASGTVDFYVSGGSLVGGNDAYIIFATTPQFLGVDDVDAANADLVAAGQVRAYVRATGAPVPAASLVAAPTALSKAPAAFGAKQTVTYTVTSDATVPKASASVDFTVNEGALVGESATHVIFAATPQFIGVEDVDAANADLVAAGQVRAYVKATGAVVPASSLAVAPAALSKSSANYGTRQTVTYTVTSDMSVPKASATVGFYVAAGNVIGQSPLYIIFGVDGRRVSDDMVDGMNEDLIAAAQVMAFQKASGSRVPNTDIEIVGHLSDDVAMYDAAQVITYTISTDPSIPPASGMVRFYVSNAPIAYDVIAGFGTYTGVEAQSATARVNADLAYFVALHLDGITVPASNYTLDSGSTLITLSKAYLDTLANGSYSYTAVYTNGTASPINLTVDVASGGNGGGSGGNGGGGSGGNGSGSGSGGSGSGKGPGTVATGDATLAVGCTMAMVCLIIPAIALHRARSRKASR
ncbi:MAG: hypothetical protein LBG81_01265, partial [Coriobacteriaceae bacterium]|nr:hypothetical protein [Coriobacteriaceae bacterium]